MEKAKPIAISALPPVGILIQQLAPTGAAAKVGMKPGDVLLKYGADEVKSVDDLTAAMKKNAEAKEVELAYWRVDERNQAVERTTKVTPGPLGVEWAKEPARVALQSRRDADNLATSVTRGGTFEDLPGTRDEVGRIASLFEEPTVLVDDHANERKIDALRRSGDLKKFRFLHFATHGKGNDVRAFDSNLVLSQDQRKDLLAKPGEPLFDNLVSAREVLDYWKLDAELVTLSACETAIGRKGGGDGLFGFAQAFLLTGSRAVCLWLWEGDGALDEPLPPEHARQTRRHRADAQDAGAEESQGMAPQP